MLKCLLYCHVEVHVVIQDHAVSLRGEPTCVLLIIQHTGIHSVNNRSSQRGSLCNTIPVEFNIKRTAKDFFWKQRENNRDRSTQHGDEFTREIGLQHYQSQLTRFKVIHVNCKWNAFFYRTILLKMYFKFHGFYYHRTSCKVIAMIFCAWHDSYAGMETELPWKNIDNIWIANDNSSVREVPFTYTYSWLSVQVQYKISRAHFY